MADTTILKLFFLNKECVLNPIWHRCQFRKESVKMLHSHIPLNIVTNFAASLFTHWHFASHIKAVNTGKLRIMYGTLFPTWGTFAPFSILPCEWNSPFQQITCSFFYPHSIIVMWQQYHSTSSGNVYSLTRLFLCEEAFIMLLLMLEPKDCGCNGLMVSVIQSPNTLWNKLGVRITEDCIFVYFSLHRSKQSLP